MISGSYEPTKDLADGVTTVFTFDWSVISSDNVKVYSEGYTSGEQTELETGFSITLNDNNEGGTVTFSSAPGDSTPADSVYIIIARSTDDTQETNLTTSGGFQADVVENAFDKRTAISQENAERLGRALTYPIGTRSSISPTLPVPVAGKALKGNADGDGWTNSDVDIDDLDTALADAEEYAGIATTKAGEASGSADEAATSARKASASADAAAASAAKITVSDTAPESPSEGDIWIDIS